MWRVGCSGNDQTARVDALEARPPRIAKKALKNTMFSFSRLNRPSRPTAKKTPKLGVLSLEERITPYSVSGNKWENQALITVSFVPDGTIVNGVASNLQAAFNTKFGSTAAWQKVFKEAAQVWAAQTNINFNFVTDSGANSGSGNFRQGDTAFGDIRIGGYNYGTGVTTLAQAYMPPLVNNYSVAGDVIFNTGQTFNIGSTYNLFTVAAHEFGHALGLNHGASNSVMKSTYPGNLTALSTDDINGIKAIYSAGAVRTKDTYDNTANNTYATASVVTSSINSSSKSFVLNSLDLTTSTDVDWYRFVVPSGAATTLKVSAIATGLSLLNPSVQIYSSTSSTTALATQTGSTYGGTVSTVRSGITAGQTYYVRVYSTDAKAAFKTGRYALMVNMGTAADPVPTYYGTQIANGSPLSTGGGVAITAGIETMVNSSSSASHSQGLNLSLPIKFACSVATTNVPVGKPAIAADANGNYVVTWTSAGQDGDQGGIFARRFDSTGDPLGDEFRVNTTITGDQVSPAIAMRDTGDFVITWASKGQDGNGWGIYAQRFNATGSLQGGEFLVNSVTAGDQLTPKVSFDNLKGNFAVAWSSLGQVVTGSWGVFAKIYDASGNVVTGDFKANNVTTGDQFAPQIGYDLLGNLVIAWSSQKQFSATSGWDIYCRLFKANGAPVTAEALVNNTTAGDQNLTSMSITPAGDWVLTWTGDSATGKDIYAKRYGTAGMGKGPEFMVNSTLTGDQAEPSVTSDKYDNLYVTWSSYNQDSSGDWGVYGQQYSTSGAPINGEFRVNTTTSGHQKNPTAIMDSAGYLTVIWGGTGSGDSDGVFKQRYSVTTSQEKPPEGDILEVGTPPAKRKAAPARSRRTRAVIAAPAPRPTHPPEDDHHHHSMIPHSGQPAAHRPLARTVSAPSTAASTPSSAMTTQTASGESSSGANTAANDLFVWLAAPAKQTSRPA